MMDNSLAICIPTYMRPHLLGLLIEDLNQQTVQPDMLIVIDGNPDSGAVYELLSSRKMLNVETIYVSSNHANVAYQRYLGWRLAKEYNFMLFLDDDIRIVQTDVVKKLITPFTWTNRNIVGVTCTIKFSKTQNPLRRTSRYNDRLVSFLSRFGSARSTRPGGITPVGDRIAPVYTGEDYLEVGWLHGGVMAFRSSALRSECFVADMFALAHVRCGMGEDTFISRCAGTTGELLLGSCTSVEHPDADQSRAYPYQERQLAFARAYSRRFLNDHCRYPVSHRFSDRLALFKHYLGACVLAWINALMSFDVCRYSYALGYTQGAFNGLTRAPTVSRLTPKIDWLADAEEALASIWTFT